MRRAVAASCAVAMFGLVTAVGAQRAGGPPATQSAAGAPSDQIKATGCLAKDESTGSYRLNNAAVEVTPWYSPTATATKATAPAPSSPLPSKTTFVLQNGTGLDQHVGHTIEITGVPAPSSANVAPTPDTIVPPRGRGPGADSAPAAGAAPEAGGAATAAGAFGGGGTQRTYLPRLDVKALKMISATCS